MQNWTMLSQALRPLRDPPEAVRPLMFAAALVIGGAGAAR
jgi:hypothetical protein